MIPRGKGFFIWNVLWCEGGDYARIADLAALAGLSHCLVKIADGARPHNVSNGTDHARRLADALRANGIEAWGWQYVYLNSPLDEVSMAAHRLEETGMAGFVVDGEGECKGRAERATRYMNILRDLQPGLVVGLSSYRFPSLHPEFPWAEFRSQCDFDLPQMYWMQAHNPVEQLYRCAGEFGAMQPARPLLITGAAFKEHGWQPTPAEVTAFLGAVNDLGLAAASFWEWYSCRRYLQPVWEAISAYAWPEDPPPQTRLVEVNVGTLNVRNAPVVEASTVIGHTYQGKRWLVDGSVFDGQGRQWWRSGPSAHLAAWLCREVRD